jgi:hypothetical protein
MRLRCRIVRRMSRLMVDVMRAGCSCSSASVGRSLGCASRSTPTRTRPALAWRDRIVRRHPLAVGRGAPLPGVAPPAAAVGFLGYGVSLVFFVLGLRHLGTARTDDYFSTALFIGAALLTGSASYLHLVETHDHEHLHEHTGAKPTPEPRLRNPASSSRPAISRSSFVMGVLASSYLAACSTRPTSSFDNSRSAGPASGISLS